MPARRGMPRKTATTFSHLPHTTPAAVPTAGSASTNTHSPEVCSRCPVTLGVTRISLWTGVGRNWDGSGWTCCDDWPMFPDLDVQLRSATTEDAGFIVEMARHACVIDDWPLPDAKSEDAQSLLPGSGDTTIVAASATGDRFGAAWTSCHDPPLVVDADGSGCRRSPSPSCRRFAAKGSAGRC